MENQTYTKERRVLEIKVRKEEREKKRRNRKYKDDRLKPHHIDNYIKCNYYKH